METPWCGEGHTAHTAPSTHCGPAGVARGRATRPRAEQGQGRGSLWAVRVGPGRWGGAQRREGGPACIRTCCVRKGGASQRTAGQGLPPSCFAGRIARPGEPRLHVISCLGGFWSQCLVHELCLCSLVPHSLTLTHTCTRAHTFTAHHTAAVIGWHVGLHFGRREEAAERAEDCLVPWPANLRSGSGERGRGGGWTLPGLLEVDPAWASHAPPPTDPSVPESLGSPGLRRGVAGPPPGQWVDRRGKNRRGSCSLSRPSGGPTEKVDR